MNLSKYLESMKNLPERFSNLAFWRGVRKLKDEIVNAFGYLNSWGQFIESKITNAESEIAKIESEIANAGNVELISEVSLTTANTSIAAFLLSADSATNTKYYNVVFSLEGITPPENAKYAFIHAEFDISDLPNNVNFTVSNFMPLTPSFFPKTGLGTIPFQHITGAPHATNFKHSFVFFYG